MARVRMVTRTVNVAEVEVMMLNIQTQKVTTLVAEVGGGITEEAALLKAVKKTYENASDKCVAITSVKQKEILYGMPEADFIRMAKVLPPRSKSDEE